jgi:tRNA uridine 5-carbamoylmethylation protein Kti12
MKFIIVSLIGIPASGKSSLSHVISRMSAENSLNANVITLNFDELLEIDFGRISDGDYKKSRENLIARIEAMIRSLTSEPETSKWAPLIAKLRVPSKFITISGPGNPHTLVILDDNNYYRSMRQRARQLSKNCKCEHFQIFAKSAASDAIERNKRRESAVDVAVIEKMFNDMETPINARTISVEIERLDEEAFLCQLRDRIERPEELTEEACVRVPQDQSIVHEVDLMTRKEVGELIKEGGGDGNLRDISSRLSEKRKEFMNDVRSGKMELSDVDTMRMAFRKFIKD